MMKNNVIIIILSFILILLLFNFFLKKQSLRLFCLRKINVQIEEFRSSAYGLGVIHIDEENNYIKSIYDRLYNQCLKQENL